VSERAFRQGEINKEFGIYKCISCGREIFLTENKVFSDCISHLNIEAEWRAIAEYTPCSDMYKDDTKDR
jgi:hypothetical protein